MIQISKKKVVQENRSQEELSYRTYIYIYIFIFLKYFFKVFLLRQIKNKTQCKNYKVIWISFLLYQVIKTCVRKHNSYKR